MGVAAGVCAGFSEIGGKTLLWDGRQTLLRRRPTEEADGVFYFFMIGMGRCINGRVMSGLARIGRHLVVRGGGSAWCERADMAGGAGVG